MRDLARQHGQQGCRTPPADTRRDCRRPRHGRSRRTRTARTRLDHPPVRIAARAEEGVANGRRRERSFRAFASEPPRIARLVRSYPARRRNRRAVCRRPRVHGVDSRSERPARAVWSDRVPEAGLEPDSGSRCEDAMPKRAAIFGIAALVAAGAVHAAIASRAASCRDRCGACCPSSLRAAAHLPHRPGGLGSRARRIGRECKPGTGSLARGGGGCAARDHYSGHSAAIRGGTGVV